MTALPTTKWEVYIDQDMAVCSSGPEKGQKNKFLV